MKLFLLIVMMVFNLLAADILPKKYDFKFIDGVNYLVFEDLLETNHIDYYDQTFRVFGLERRDGALRSAVFFDVKDEDVSRMDGLVYIDMTNYNLNHNRNILKTRYIGMRTTVYTNTGIIKDRVQTNYVVRRF